MDRVIGTQGMAFQQYSRALDNQCGQLNQGVLGSTQSIEVCHNVSVVGYIECRLTYPTIQCTIDLSHADCAQL